VGAFRFRLQVLLDLRARQEDEARAVWSARLQEAERERQRLDMLVAERAALQVRVEASKQGNVDVGSLAEANRLAEYMRSCILQQEIVLKEAMVRVAEAQQALQAAATARKAVEKLRDRKQSEHAHEEQRREQDFLDEVAVLRAVRRESGPSSS